MAFSKSHPVNPGTSRVCVCVCARVCVRACVCEISEYFPEKCSGQ